MKHGQSNVGRGIEDEEHCHVLEKKKVNPREAVNVLWIGLHPQFFLQLIC